MRIVFLSYYYPPDLCAGSFRASALTQALRSRLAKPGDIHVITTHPNRYSSHRVSTEDETTEGNVTIHRIRVSGHQNGILSQVRSFSQFAYHGLRLSRRLEPDFLIGTTGRFMTAVLTWITAAWTRVPYFIDLRDIFSETISDLAGRKNRLVGRVCRRALIALEREVLTRAAGVNVVSGGFPEYFENAGLDTSKWSQFTNGVDSEFIGVPHKEPREAGQPTCVVYAGNIGSGQGLETILPEAAAALGSEFQFLVVGDGGARDLLADRIAGMGITNIQILPPVARSKLAQYYHQADILFVHLNAIPAFERVLPSKIFEYAALGKPILAGISGYSANFLNENVPHSYLFPPGDVDRCITATRNARGGKVCERDIEAFTDRFARENIMNSMAERILMVATAGSTPPEPA